jgi:hypothetical protein
MITSHVPCPDETTIIWGACGSVRLYVCLVSLIDPCDWLWEILSVHMKFGQLWDDEREVMPCFHRRHRVLASLSSRSKGRHTSGACLLRCSCMIVSVLLLRYNNSTCAIVPRSNPSLCPRTENKPSSRSLNTESISRRFVNLKCVSSSIY